MLVMYSTCSRAGLHSYLHPGANPLPEHTSQIFSGFPRKRVTTIYAKATLLSKKYWAQTWDTCSDSLPTKRFTRQVLSCPLVQDHSWKLESVWITSHLGLNFEVWSCVDKNENVDGISSLTCLANLCRMNHQANLFLRITFASRSPNL